MATTPSRNTRSSKTRKLNSVCPSCNLQITETSKAITCHICYRRSHSICYNVPEAVFLFLRDNPNSNVNFTCDTCLNSNLTKSVDESTEIQAQMTILTAQVGEISKQVTSLTEAHQKLEKSSANISTAAEAFTANQQSFANIVASTSTKSDNTSQVTSIAKQVLDTQKQLTSEREKREKNAIMFNVQESNTDENEDISYFKSMCQRILGMETAPEVKLTRIGEKRPDHARPIIISFTDSWDKRKFLSSLYKLRLNESYNKITVAHDMCEADRAENKRLLKQAYQKNLDEKTTTFKYKVRGPPWNLKIIKVYAKN